MRHYKILPGVSLVLLAAFSTPLSAKDDTAASPLAGGVVSATSEAWSECPALPDRACLTAEVLDIVQSFGQGWRRIEDVRQRNDALGNAGTAMVRIDRLNDALSIFRDIGEGFYSDRLSMEIVRAMVDQDRFAEALDAARETRTASRRVSALLAVAEAQSDPDIFAEALTVARGIEATNRRSMMGAVFSAQTRAGQADKAMSAALRLEDNIDRDLSIRNIVSVKVELGDFAGALSTVQAIEGEKLRTAELAEIARSRAEAGQFSEALSIADRIERSLDFKDAMRDIIASQVKAGRINDAATNARRLEKSGSRASAFLIIAGAEPDGGLFEEALSIARSIRSDQSKAKVIGKLAALRSDPSLAKEALEIARGIERADRRANALGRVAGATQADRAVFDEALSITQGMDAGRRLTHALAAICKGQMDAGYFRDALITVEKIEGSKYYRTYLYRIVQGQAKAGRIEAARSTVEQYRDTGNNRLLLEALVFGEIEAGYLSEALNDAQTAADPMYRERLMYRMVERLLQSGRIADALTTARTIRHAEIHAIALRIIVETRFDPEIFKEAVAASRSIEEDWVRARELSEMVSLAPEDEGTPADPSPTDRQPASRSDTDGTHGPEASYSAEDVRAWYFYDQAGGDTIRDVYRSLIFEKQNTEWMLQIAGVMNRIDDSTPPDRILAYIDQVMMKVQESREVLSLIAGVTPMRSSNQGNLYTLWLLNAARNKYQDATHDHADLEQDGFTKLSPQKSAFHAIGLDASRVEKWVHDDGREYVFQQEQAGQMTLVFDGINNGTYNYCKLPACHMILDILPWVKWGASLDDPSTAEDRAILFRNSLALANYSWRDLTGFF